MPSNDFKNDTDTPLSKKELLEGDPQVVLHLGVTLTASLLRDEVASFRLTKQGHVQLSHNKDVICLHELKENKALEVLALLGYSDEDMLAHIKRRESFKI